jgi:CDP-diacylglycerol--glycerol-3-phosphate 3-phosphatidyltransferase
MWSIPNLLSIFRIIAAPFLLLAARLGSEQLFFLLFILMLLSDALDGIVARMLHQTSELGARLDSYGDILTYLSTPLAIWWLWPQIVTEEKEWIIAAILLYIAPAIVSLIKFKKLASYHTYITKISAVLMSTGVLVLLIWREPLLFHAAVCFLVLEAVENIAVTLILPQQKSDIHTLWQALHYAKRFYASKDSHET